MMYRILMTGMSSHLAGLETFALNILRNIDKSKFQIDFIKRTKDKVVFEEEIISAGSKIIYIPRKYSDLTAYNKAMEDLFKNNKYDAIWDNSMRIPNIDFLIYAKKYGIKERIIHSHTSFWNSKSPKKIFHYINRHRINNIATKFFACSNSAADFMFTGQGRKNVILINNAIDFDKYTYSEEKRTYLRKKYDLENNYVIGHAGRIDPIKNQRFLVKLLSRLESSNKNFKLVLVGEFDRGIESYGAGLEEYIKELNLQDKIILAGRQTDMSAWLSLMDIFIMPSLHEGLPFAAIEAQANGLPLILSTGISKEADITGNVEYLSLSEDISKWNNAVIKGVEKGRFTSEDMYSNLKEKGYILKENVKLVEEILL